MAQILELRRRPQATSDTWSTKEQEFIACFRSLSRSSQDATLVNLMRSAEQSTELARQAQELNDQMMRYMARKLAIDLDAMLRASS